MHHTNTISLPGDRRRLGVAHQKREPLYGHRQQTHPPARYYWDAEIDDCWVRQTNASFLYGYEYLGVQVPFFISPLLVLENLARAVCRVRRFSLSGVVQRREVRGGRSGATLFSIRRGS